MYSLSMKPQYENWCNCCVVRLFSPWVTPGPCLCLFIFLLCHFFSPFPPITTLPCSLAPCQFMCCLFPPCSLSFLRSLCSFSLSLSTALLPLSPTATQAWFTSTTGWREGLLSATGSSHMVLCPRWQRLTNLQSLLLPYFLSMWKQQQWRKKHFECEVLYRESCFFSGSFLHCFFNLMLATLAVDNNVSLSCYMSA